MVGGEEIPWAPGRDRTGPGEGKEGKEGKESSSVSGARTRWKGVGVRRYQGGPGDLAPG